MTETQQLEAWCSWCHERTRHALAARNYLRRNVYTCGGCGRRTLKCRLCGNAARGGQGEGEGGIIQGLDARWDDEFCAEHAGEIASFEALHERLEDLADFRRLLRRKRRNAKRISQVALVGTTTAAVAAPFALMAAPGLAAAVGSAGIWTSVGGASLATLGGTTLGGVAVMTAAGAALGGVMGGVIFNAYAGQIEDLDVRMCRAGLGPAVIFVDGLLTDPRASHEAWVAGARGRVRGSMYHLSWETRRLAAIGGLLSGASTTQAAARLAGKLARRGGKRLSRPLALARGATVGLSLLKNPWHVAQARAGMTGVVLADLLARTDHPDGFILIGHSLGARVIRFALEALATREGAPLIREAHLLGGAVGPEDWAAARPAVDGAIFNYHSDRDLALKALYRAANLFAAAPIGVAPIEGAGVTNVDVSAIVGGHLEHRARLAEVLEAGAQP